MRVLTEERGRLVLRPRADRNAVGRWMVGAGLVGAAALGLAAWLFAPAVLFLAFTPLFITLYGLYLARAGQLIVVEPGNRRVLVGGRTLAFDTLAAVMLTSRVRTLHTHDAIQVLRWWRVGLLRREDCPETAGALDAVGSGTGGAAARRLAEARRDALAEKALALLEHIDEAQVRQVAERLAAAVERPLIDAGGDEIAVRSPADLARPLAERLPMQPTDPPGTPPPEMAGEEAGAHLRLRWTVVRSAKTVGTALATAVVLGGGAAAALLLPLSPWGRVACVLPGLALPLLAPALSRREVHELEVDADRVRYRTPEGETTFDVSGLRDLRVEDTPAPGLHLIGDGRVVRCAMVPAQAAWARRRLTAFLARSAPQARRVG
jgi:hypothetical protein